MKLLIVAALIAVPVFAHDCLNIRSSIRSAVRDAQRARVEAMREVRSARSNALREASRARVEARRAMREAIRESYRGYRAERRWRM
jgi:hypothetical protein